MEHEITGKTKLTALLGSPVAHSISPHIHNAAFRQLGLDYVYLAFDVKPEQLEEAVRGLKAVGICGFNLTMPHKVRILPLLDELTPAARLAGSVNTVTLRDGWMIGHTTDGEGYMRSLAENGQDVIGKKMTLLGAGGAACAICAQAAMDGVAAIDMFKRRNASWGKAESFCETVAGETGCRVRLLDINDPARLAESIAESAILTNATNVGMAPNTGKSPIPDASVLREGMFVSDIIYNPRETRLLKDARERGCVTQNGLQMLLFQGAASFACWTGREMPVSSIRLP